MVEGGQKCATPFGAYELRVGKEAVAFERFEARLIETNVAATVGTVGVCTTCDQELIVR